MISVKYSISEEIPEILEYVKTKHPKITTLILLVHLKGNFFKELLLKMETKLNLQC